MSMQAYYMTWRTWREQQVQTPWEFWFLSEGATLKPRSHMDPLVTPPDPHQIQSAWEAQNQTQLDEWDRDFISDVCLAAFVYADSEVHAQSQVRALFADAEFIKCVVVTPDIKQQIISLFDQTIQQAKGQT